MTREEAISIMNVIVHMLEPQYDTDRIEDAVDMAIKALNEKPKIGQWIKTDKRIKDNLYVWKVTCCGREFIADADLKSRDNYCLNCGAKIESEDICSTTQLTI